MAYPNTSVLNIIIPQTSASIDPTSTQAPFVERIISGSRLVLQTDTTGTLIGSSDLNVNSITASNISASGYISASNLYVTTNITDAGTLNVVGATTLAGLTGTTATFSGLVSASAGLTASAIQDAGTLTVVGNSTLSNVFATNVTASNISASGNISSSNLWIQNSIVDGGTLTVLGNTVLGDAITDTTIITGSASISGSLTVVGPTTLQSTFVTNLTASNISASRIVASEITASSELFVGTGPAYRTYAEAFAIPSDNVARVYVSGSVSVVSKYATLTLATSASLPGANSSILFARLNDRISGSGVETVLEPRMQIGVDSGSNDLRFFAYYVSDDPENNSSGENIVAGTRAILKQSGYFGIGNFISYGSLGGAKTTYVSSLPGYAGNNVVGPDAMLTILPMDSASFGTAATKQFNRNILNIMNYDTSSIMFISGSDGYVLLGKNTTDGINRLQVVGNVSASAYTGSSANFTNLIATNITSSNISASGYISASSLRVETSIVDGGTLTVLGSTVLGDTTADTTRITGSTSISGSLTVVGDTILQSTFVTNLTASNISASGNISSSTLYVVNNATINGDLTVNGGDIVLSSSATNIALKASQVGALIIKDSASEYINITTSPTAGNVTFGTNPTVKITNTNNPTSYTDTVAALQVDGGARISKDTYISGSLNVAGDLTIFGSSSVVYISSSTVIINDNIIQLNAYFPFERYAGFEVFDSGSNQRSASLLWDGQNDNWITVDQNNSSSNVIVGPTASFGTNPGSLLANNIPKAYDATGITTSSLSDDGTTLRYTGNVISASSITASYGTLTYITGALVTYVTGSFTTLTISTGSAPNAGGIVPAHPTASGMAGQINVDNNFVYVYTNNIWKRVPLSTWSL
jgi:hypothetical protein